MGGRYVTVGRSDLSRLLFEKIKGTTEVIFGDEIVGLQERDDSCRFSSNIQAIAGSIW